MKIKLLIFGIMTFISNSSIGKECDCRKIFLTVKSHIETNYAGFQDKVNKETYKVYDAWNDLIWKKTGHNFEKAAYCIYFILEWMTFFKDRHLQIRSTLNPSDTTESVAEEIIFLTADELGYLKTSRKVEGIYIDKENTTKIAVIKRPNSFRTHVGLVLETTSTKWKPGQIILEIRPDPLSLNKFEGIRYANNRTPRKVAYSLGIKTLGEDWMRYNDSQKGQRVFLSPQNVIQSKMLDDDILYVKIGSFNQIYASEIASVFNEQNTLLNSVSNLIIDLRGNSGGADFSYEPILPYIYTQPMTVVGADIYATEANIRGWKELLDMRDIPDDEKADIAAYVKGMTENIGGFLPLIEDEVISFASKKLFPKKVILLIDEGCASTSEQFILTAKESKKVILMGNHTSGVLDYANMRAHNIDGTDYRLFYATSRSRRIDLSQGIDNKGIVPDVLLSKEEEWVRQSILYLKEMRID
uniref:Peptidase S41 n=1 Tax=Sphingobacterium sp. (strain 21) TaxID=743722 RepID=F4C9X3_SPHS2